MKTCLIPTGGGILIEPPMDVGVYPLVIDNAKQGLLSTQTLFENPEAIEYSF